MSNFNPGHIVKIIGWQGYVEVSGSPAGFVMQQRFSPGYFVGDRPAAQPSYRH
jgi:hypothetical protein